LVVAVVVAQVVLEVRLNRLQVGRRGLVASEQSRQLSRRHKRPHLALGKLLEAMFTSLAVVVAERKQTAERQTMPEVQQATAGVVREEKIRLEVTARPTPEVAAEDQVITEAGQAVVVVV
jgi:hypothetical protein